MAVNYRGMSVGTFNSTTGAVTFVDPGQRGDLLLAVFSQDQTATWTPPDSTWSSLGYTHMTLDGQSVEVWYKKKSAGGAGQIVFANSTLPFTLGGIPTCYFAIYAYSGCDPVNPVNVPAGILYNSTPQVLSWDVVSPSVTTKINDCRLVSVAFTDQNATGTQTITSLTPGFVVRDFVSAPTCAYMAVGVADAPAPIAGATGSATWSLNLGTAAAVVTGYMIALGPPVQRGPYSIGGADTTTSIREKTP